MSYTVAKVKTFTGRGGRGYSAQLLFDGKVVADAFNEGNGGDVNLDWHDKSKRVPLTVVEKPGSPIAHFWPEEAKLLQFCKGQTRSFLDEIFDLTIYLYVGELVDNFVLEKELRRKCKTKTCFRLKSSGSDTYMCYSAVYTKEVQDTLKKRYGDDLELIYNETLFKG